MILRRLADGIRNQDWFTVVVEVLIVVVGIFLGLQVDDWNEARKDKALESEYLGRIATDLRTDLTTLSDIAAYVPKKKNAIALLARAVDTATPDISPEDLFAAIDESAAYGWQIPWVRLSTFEDLLSTGRLALVHDAELRTDLQDYYFSASHRLERIMTRTTGYADKIYVLADADQLSPFLIHSGDLEARRSAARRNVAVSAARAMEFLEAARDANLKELINAELNYATFLSRMVADQIEETENLLAILSE